MSQKVKVFISVLHFTRMVSKGGCKFRAIHKCKICNATAII